MAGEVEAEHFLLAGEHLRFRPFRGIGQRRRFQNRLAGGAKQAVLAGLARALKLLPGIHRPVYHREQLRAARPPTVQGSGFDQAFEHAFVERARVHAFAEIENGFKAAGVLTSAPGCVHRIVADVLDRPKAEADRLAGGAEVPGAGLNVGRQERDAPVAAFIDVLDDLVAVAHLVGQQGRHELDRIMGFQIGRHVGQHRVGRRMGLVEPVPGELFHQIEDADDFLLRVAALHRPLHKAVAQGRHLLRLFLAHGAAQQVGLPQAESGEPVGDLHDLFLIDDDPVRLREDFFELRQVVGDRLLAVLARDEVVNHPALKRPGAVEGVQCGQVFELRGVVAAQDVAHPARFKLEDAAGQAV